MTLEQHLNCIDCNRLGIACDACGRSTHIHWMDSADAYLDLIRWYRSVYRSGYWRLLCPFCLAEVRG